MNAHHQLEFNNFFVFFFILKIIIVKHNLSGELNTVKHGECDHLVCVSLRVNFILLEFQNINHIEYCLLCAIIIKYVKSFIMNVRELSTSKKCKNKVHNTDFSDLMSLIQSSSVIW